MPACSRQHLTCHDCFMSIADTPLQTTGVTEAARVWPWAMAHNLPPHDTHSYLVPTTIDDTRSQQYGESSNSLKGTTMPTYFIELAAPLHIFRIMGTSLALSHISSTILCCTYRISCTCKGACFPK